MRGQSLAFGFRDLKVKLSGDAVQDRAKMAAIQRWSSSSIRVRVDVHTLRPT
jgi:L-alanine-DL-glutamate epimerase-like enolase superfamily enzyme